MPSALPVGVSAFIGRERERAKVADLVADVRIVTLTGSGGSGKTRLAVEVVGDVASRFADGACWADLQGVSEPAMVAPAVGAAVGVHERSTCRACEAVASAATIPTSAVRGWSRTSSPTSTASGNRPD